ncbi:MAG: hypothetical protein ACRED2_09530, partial [Methylocella sp.]
VQENCEDLPLVREDRGERTSGGPEAFHSFCKNAAQALKDARPTPAEIAELIGHEKGFTLSVYARLACLCQPWPRSSAISATLLSTAGRTSSCSNAPGCVGQRLGFLFAA